MPPLRFVIPLAALALAAADWPRFRGPNGSGAAADADPPASFDKSAGVLWTTPLPGGGNSSPCVVGGKVFLQTTSADGAERRLVALDAAAGSVLWSKAVPGKTAKTHPKNSLASSSPAADAERVYALFWDGAELTLAAFDHVGNEVWKAALGPFQARHGAGASPVVVGDRVVVANDQDGSAAVAAFDARTGKRLWSVPRKASKEASYSTPLVRETPAGPEIVVGSSSGLSGYDPKGGGELWSWDWQFKAGSLRMVSSPVLGAGLVFATTGNGAGNSHAVAVRPGGGGKPGELVWEKTRGWPYVPMLLEHDGYLYTVHDKGLAGCYDARTGKEAWTARLGSDGFTASPVLAGGRVYAVSEKGTLYAFAADPAGFRPLAKHPLGVEVYASPAVAGGRLYVRGKQSLVCVGKK